MSGFKRLKPRTSDKGAGIAQALAGDPDSAFLAEGSPITVSKEPGSVSEKSNPPRLPHGPSRVLDFVFEAAAAPLRRVAPIMLRDELTQGALRGKETLPFGFDPHRTSIRSGAPCIFGFHDPAFGTGFNSMRHRHAGIVFVERNSRDGCHRVSRHQLPDEHDASSGRPPHVKPKVHLLERLVKRHGEPTDARVVELETNQAEVGFTFECVELSACGNERLQQRGRDRMVEHEQALPLRRQKRVRAPHRPV